MRELVLVEGSKSVKVTMYSGADDPDLPSHVKGLALNLRSRWVNNYNWAIQETLDNTKAREQADSYTSVSITDLLAANVLKEHGETPAPAPADPNVTITTSVPSAVAGEPAVLTTTRTHVPLPPQVAPQSIFQPAGATPQVPEMGLFERFKSWLRLDEDRGVPSTLSEADSTFFTLSLKADGRLHVMLPYSNNFRDREKQIVTEAAHKEYVDSAEAGKAEYPELHLWHAGPDTRWGQIETVSYVDGFAIAGGVVDVGKEHVALKLKEIADKGELAVSFGFRGLLGPQGLYHLYRPFEISPLPVGSEANPYMIDILNVAESKEMSMAFSDKKKNWLKANFNMDDAAIAAAEVKYGEAASKFKALGLEFKEDGESAESPPPPPAPPSPNPVPPPPNPVVAAHDPNLLTMLGDLASSVKELKDQVAVLSDPKNIDKRAEELILAKVGGASGGYSAANAGNNVVATKESETDPNNFVLAAFGSIGFNGGPTGAMVGAANGAVPPAITAPAPAS